MVPPGQVHTLPAGGLRTAGASWETARRLSRCCCCFFFFPSPPPTGQPRFSLLPSPSNSLLPRLQPSHFRMCPYRAPTLGFFQNVAGLCRLLCLEPLEHTVELQSVARAGFTAAFSLSVPPSPAPNLRCPALALCQCLCSFCV